MGNKTLCEWRRSEIGRSQDPAQNRAQTQVRLRQCARSANDKSYLCQPLRLKEKEA